MIQRRKTRTVTVKNVKIGSGHPVSIQSMAKTKTSDIPSTVSQIKALEKRGCEIIRVAVKDSLSAKAINDIKKEISIPIIADIHFDHKLALSAIKSGADKIRINPGNIQKEDDINQVIDAAGEANIPIRIGLNSGSLPGVEEKDIALGMVKSAVEYLRLFEKRNFKDIVISLKASDVKTTVRAYREMSKVTDCPLHVGITASGLPEDGIIKSSMGIGSLLLDGIGDTIRVSLTGDPLLEVYAAKKILSASGVRKFGPDLISCPTCGRCQVDLISMVKEVNEALKREAEYNVRDTDKAPLIAIMGCEVNGPGEAKGADIGIAFGLDKGAIFCKGKIVKTVPATEAVFELMKMIREM